MLLRNTWHTIMVILKGCFVEAFCRIRLYNVLMNIFLAQKSSEYIIWEIVSLNLFFEFCSSILYHILKSYAYHLDISYETLLLQDRFTKYLPRPVISL